MWWPGPGRYLELRWKLSIQMRIRQHVNVLQCPSSVVPSRQLRVEVNNVLQALSVVHARPQILLEDLTLWSGGSDA